MDSRCASTAETTRHPPARRATLAGQTLGLVAAAGLVVLLLSPTVALAAVPAIRSAPANQVPGCVTPERLMAFIATRNKAPEPRFRRIAWDYKAHGEHWRVRWDYAFFQMIVETNYLLFRRGDGKPGDVKPRQNNFAGLGTTGGGVPGDSYRDVSTGVLAQIQHLVVYSGERITNPAGPRTRLSQDAILSASARVARQRPVTFQDLSGRWAVDRRYGRTIGLIAQRFHEQFCSGREAVVASSAGSLQSSAASGAAAWTGRTVTVPPRPRPARRQADQERPANIGRSLPAGGKTVTAAAPTSANDTPAVGRPAPANRATARQAAGAQPPGGCRIQVASFGGDRAMLIRAEVAGEVQLTALRVLAGFEDELARSFIAAHAPGGQAIGTYDSSDAALKQAYDMCRQPGRS